jgi:hypothetical protein
MLMKTHTAKPFTACFSLFSLFPHSIRFFLLSSYLSQRACTETRCKSTQLNFYFIHLSFSSLHSLLRILCSSSLCSSFMFVYIRCSRTFQQTYPIRSHNQFYKPKSRYKNKKKMRIHLYLSYFIKFI